MSEARPADGAVRMAAVHQVLDGLSVGDALGSALGEGYIRQVQALVQRQIPAGLHRYTDDTAMAIEVAGVLQRCGTIDEDLLARAFAARYAQEPGRGYGGTAHRILTAIAQGQPWREVSRAAFGGSGSMGNGSAMRVAPIGAYFADDPARIVEEARRSALPTHYNDDAQAGAVAIALAVGWCLRTRQEPAPASQLFAHVLALTPESEVRAGIVVASQLPPGLSGAGAAQKLGSGADVLCRDTVPFVLYSAAHTLDSFERAFWQTADGQGDVDTTCAMVGALLAAAGCEPPATWLAARESLPLPLALAL